MSGPLDVDDTAEAGRGTLDAPPLEVTADREVAFGEVQVWRALPRRGRRSIGPWCFADHLRPTMIEDGRGLDIGPHPHIGLQTVTWLVAGQVLHRDSLGNEQLVRPGQLNLMTAGRGVAHSEETTGIHRGPLHGVQLWMAQAPDARQDPPAFEHHGELPTDDLGSGQLTVIIGELGSLRSPARCDLPAMGIDLRLRAGTAAVPGRPDFEYGCLVLEGALSVEGHLVLPGHLAALGRGRSSIDLGTAEPSRALLLGGRPFGHSLHMWWNFVAGDRHEIELARRDWAAGGDRFGRVASSLPRIEAPEPPWQFGERPS